MKIMRLQGGLGNQMFQYAAIKGVEPNQERLYLDHDFFNRTIRTNEFISRKYELKIFKNIRACKAKRDAINFFTSNSLYYKILRCLYKSVFVVQKENEFVSLGDIQNKKYVYFNGYFQSEKYFKHIREELLKEFEFPSLDEKNDKVKKLIETSLNSVSIHIRRDDYLISRVQKVHGVLPLRYYYSALDILKNNEKQLTIFFFSDDIQWVKENFILSDLVCYYIDYNKSEDSWKDMALMTFCKHHIVANSSFSWWGAWLSKKNGKNFAPSNWYNPNIVKFDIHDLIPPNWIIVDYD